jgi:hypothetical protein
LRTRRERLARWTVFLACVLAAPAAAQTGAAPQPDSVLLAQTLAEELTAIDARRPAARAAVAEWKRRVARCGKPRLGSRDAREAFASVTAMAAHTVALRSFAPDLERFAARLRALPVTDAVVRGGIRELLRDYDNAKRLIADGPADVCRLVRASRRGGPRPDVSGGDSEDVRGSIRALKMRESRLVEAQRALLRIEADPQLARAMDALFSHATAGLHGPTSSGPREVLVPPFPVVVDPAGLTRLRDEAATITRATEPLAQAQKRIGRELTRTLRRGPACTRVVVEGLRRRRKAVGGLYVVWLYAKLHAATAEPATRFRQELAGMAVTDRALAQIVERVADDLRAWGDGPSLRICSVLRTWRRHAWSRRHTPALARDPLVTSGHGEMWSGTRLEDETIHRAVLARRGMPRRAMDAFLQPVDFLVATVQRVDGEAALAALGASRR